jgi:hypothetical protein
VDTAQSMSPFGWPGSDIFLVVILTVSSGESDKAVHIRPLELLILTQNVLIILWANFIKFFRASGEGRTVD